MDEGQIGITEELLAELVEDTVVSKAALRDLIKKWRYLSGSALYEERRMLAFRDCANDLEALIK